MRYNEYTTGDFLNDESFQNYVLKTDNSDTAFWSDWIRQNPEKKEEVEEAAKILASFSIKTLPVDLEKYNQDLQRIKNTLDFSQTAQTTTAKRRSFGMWRVAAAIALVLAVGIFAYRYVVVPTEPLETIYFEKSNPRGVKSTVMLPDGSKVKLNSQSNLQYEEDYEKGERKVYLRGEAFFEVVENPSKPFTVYAGNISTTALGTSFNVKAYPEDEIIEVYLVTGKVEVKNVADQTNLTLLPDEGARFDMKNNIFSPFENDIDQILAWRSGTLVFKKADFPEVLKRLERWYNVEFVLNGAPQDSWSLTGEFQNESLENVLRGIGHTTHYDFKITGNKVIINF
ncbi:DUF4974 domain-containing protein [Fulvivirgaceae bacterium BMA12]|uniref:DUF4974 domain-containing protein n=1 Tax=Agaribacillus aureus TaxID=3051825 RepID=A0ABT8LH46_9BACT|nr:DUF4974 domain-containing protein [Fulvivirgaceae bacterium BMA12]